jgi:choline monooxygenase
MLNILPGRLQMNAVTPHARHLDYFYDTVDTLEARQRVERDVAFSDRVQQEDIEICEHVQRGLQSRAYDRGRFSVEMEAGVYHFQRLLKRAYRRRIQ